MKRTLSIFLSICILAFTFQNYHAVAAETSGQIYKEKINLAELKVLSVKDNCTTYDKITEVPIDKPITINPADKFKLTDIDVVAVESNGEFLPAYITKIDGKELQIKPVNPYFKDSKYTIKIYTKQLKKFNLDFYTERSYDAQGWEQVKYSGKVDIYDPTIDLSQINKKANDISVITFEQNGKLIGLKYELSESSISIKEELPISKSYTLKIVTNDNKNIKLSFESSGLPQLYDDGTRRIVKVPAIPEEGFYWPYFLVLPSSQYKEENKGNKRYLMIDTTNTGVDNNFNICAAKVEQELKNMSQVSLQTAEKLWSPALMPVFPRPQVSYTYDSEYNMIYTHGLDRDTATLHLKMKDKNLYSILNTEFKNAGFDINKFVKLDAQMAAMSRHAIKYLNQYGNKVENKVFMAGYSASGSFTNRFSFLQPDLVKAVASGAANDDMVLPLSQYKGKNLIYPLGTYDYKDITGRNYSQSEQNKIARLIYMGEDDTNNVVPYSDCYGDKERNIITSLWGLEVLPRAQQLSKLYGESGGKGIIILDKGIGHSSSESMINYVLEFFKANRDKDQPEYPIPSNPQQLKYTLYK